MKHKKGFLDFVSENTFVHILLSIILGFIVGAGFLAVMGLSVGAAYGRLLNSVTTLKGFSYVIVYSVPYIVTGLSVAFSFKTGVFNIGAEGQFVVGSMAACVLGILCPDIPKPPAPPAGPTHPFPGNGIQSRCRSSPAPGASAKRPSGLSGGFPAWNP